jgi:Tfp pilus assembly protein PilO
MSMTDRDRKVVLLLVPILLIAAYWFLLLAPKREEASEATATLTEQTVRRDAAQAQVNALSGDRTDFAADYGEIVRLGKAVPPAVDMPTILVQLDAAARGTKIVFTRITAEERVPAATTAAAPPAAPGSGDGSQPAAAGGAPAQSAPGTAAESAGNAVNGSNAASSAAESGVAPADTQTSQAASNGALPVGGGAATTDPATGMTTSATPGLDTVPITLEFVGTFFDLADFTHRIKRYVESTRGDVLVRGRLITIDGVDFKSQPDTFPAITATLTATAYLAPAAEGATAGATPSGPEAVPASVDADATASTATPAATATR